MPKIFISYRRLDSQYVADSIHDHMGRYFGADIPVFLLDIYAKGEKIDLTQDEKNTLRSILGRIAESYRRKP